MKIDVNFPPFVGSVELKEPIPFLQIERYAEAERSCGVQFCPEAFAMVMELAAKLPDKKRRELSTALDSHILTCSESDKRPRCRIQKDESQVFVTMLPLVLGCVAMWSVAGIPEGVTIDTFPGTPMQPVHQLVGKLMTEIGKVMKGNSGDPNVLLPESTPTA